MLHQEIRRGDIYYVYRGESTGCEQQAGRPAIIVSNDVCNACSPVVEVVYLTAQPKKRMPTHVAITSSRFPSTAMCEQIHSVAKERLGDYAAACTEKEMEEINRALAVSLALGRQTGKSDKENEKIQTEIRQTCNVDQNLSTHEQILCLQAANQAYRHMLDVLAGKLTVVSAARENR